VEACAQPRRLSEGVQELLQAAIGLRKRATLSAYRLVRRSTDAAPMGCKRPTSVALSNTHCSGSMAMMKSMGESGSPWRSPSSTAAGGGVSMSEHRRWMAVIAASVSAGSCTG
jgi:hypothetical protein